MNKPMIPFRDLNLIDRFLFDCVVEDAQTQQDILSIIFEREIPFLSQNETEKELRISPHLRTIRLDVFSMDEEQAIYMTEMQKSRKPDLRRRSRYYQGIMDTSLLEPGIPNYNCLNDTYIIMIMPFDLFGLGKYRYTFRSRCEEDPSCRLQDGAVRIFLNTRGTNDDEVSRELVDFLHYVEKSEADMASASGSAHLMRIHRRVQQVKENEEMGVKYVQAWEERYYEIEEAKAEGIAVGKAEGIAVGKAEGIAVGSDAKLRELITRKMNRGLPASEIADALEEDLSTVTRLMADIKNTPSV